MYRMLYCMTCALLLHTAAASAADINVATNMANVPFEFDDASGALVGFEVDLMNLVGERLNKSVEFTEMPFNSLFAAVSSGRSNTAIGSITITKKRLESVSFTQPFYDADACLTTLANGDVKGLEDMAGKDVAVITGSTGEIWATENNDKYKFHEIRHYDANNDPMLDIAAGRVAGYVHDCPIDAYYIRDKPQYAIVATIPTHEQFGIMLTKDSPLVEEVNAAITTLKNEGELGKLHKKWFGTEAAPGSSTVTVLPIPQL